MASEDKFPLQLHKWAVTELLVISKRVPNAFIMPSADDLKQICRGKNVKEWRYLIEHVRSRASVRKVKSELHMYRNIFSKPIVLSENTPDKNCDLKHQLITLKGRISFLKNEVMSLEERLSARCAKMKEIENSVTENEKFLGLLLLAVHSFDFKAAHLQLLLSNLDSNIQAVKQTEKPTTDNEDFKFNQLLFPVNHACYVDTENAVHSIKSILSQINKDSFSQINFGNFYSIKNEILEKISQMLNKYVAFDIMLCLEEQNKRNNDLINHLQLKNLGKTETHLKVDVYSHADNSITLTELQRQKVFHIHKFMESLKLKKELCNLSEEVAHSSAILYQNCHDPNNEINELRWNVFETTLKCHSLNFSVQNLKQLIYDIDCETKELQKRNIDELAAVKEIQHYQSCIVSKRNEMCEFLNQNRKFISHSNERHLNIRESASKCIAVERSIIENVSEVLKVNPEVETKMHFIKMKFLKPDLSTYGISDLYVCKKILKAFKTSPFRSENHIVQCCIHMVNNIFLSKEILNDRQKALLYMESVKPTDCCQALLAEQKQILNQACSMIDNSNEMLKLGEKLLLDIPQYISDWWEQPAQYVYPIKCENGTLKEWISLLTMFLNS